MERRLAAILAADVVGYSRLMEQDEAGTFERLRRLKAEVVEPTIARHRGRIFKLMGDGLLAEFASAVDAVECAAAIQQAMGDANRNAPDRRIELRIGLHVGDVIVEGEDRHGEAVNVAARLQELAEPTGICVSRRVMDLARQKIALGFALRGEERLKNIAEPVTIYSVRPDGAASRQAPPLPDKPSIAVLPFQNLSGDPEQDYFADGMVEEITMALSRMRWLFVIARNSSFTYKGRAVDVKQVGRELGVRYVLEGSVRKAGEKVRIAGQLIDAATGAHLWADRFEGNVEDIFDLQDQVTASVVGAIAPKLEEAEIERALRKPTENLDAYDHFMRGMADFHQWTREGCAKALSNFYLAIEIDPNFASAYALAAWCYCQRKVNGWRTDPAEEAAETERLARRAVALGTADALVLGIVGLALGYVVGDVSAANTFCDRAVLLNRNLTWAWLYSGWAKVWIGEPEVAIERAAHAMRLSPNDPQSFNILSVIAAGHFFAGRYGEAITWAERALHDRPDFMSALRFLAASSAMAGQQQTALRSIERLLQLDPTLRVSKLKELTPIRRPVDLNRYIEGMRKAGLPE